MTAEEILLAVLEKPTPAERSAYLDGACGQDEALRVQVEGLLRAHQEAGSFLEQPLFRSTPTIDDPITERPGTVIGPYKLLEQIGEGGFGVVFMAEQSQPVRRKVALKILKPGMDTRQVVARFEAERQALAIMDHPNIAKVFDGGSTSERSTSEPEASAKSSSHFAHASGSGRPYFVMELVKGVPITDFCDQNHLTPRQRLELFVPVCQAVQHAHQKGIIHRDLKPSNILVSRHDSTPVPKVIDFGVAKALGQELTDKTLFTGIAQMVGTPLYMSPEQAGMSDLDVDTRSDIYSLGVLLYELLTGTTPFSKERFKQAAYDEIRRIIREEEPPKPSTRLSELSRPHAPREDSVTRSVTTTLASVSALRHTEPAKLTKLVRGELDWIVMKALEKDRNRRYETANGFAMDIQRYLNDEPVVAGPPSARYRLKKFLRRNRGPVLAVAALVLAIVAGLAGVSWQWWRAETSLKDADQQRTHAEESLRGALETVDRFCKDVSEDVLLNEPGMQPLRKRLLESARDYYQKFIEERGDNPRLRRELAMASLRLGKLVGDLGSSEEALDLTQRAVTLFDRLVAEHPDVPDHAHDRATSYHALGDLYRLAHRLPEAKTALQTALAIQEEVAQRHSEVASYQNRLALILDDLGLVYSVMKDVESAEPAYNRALRILERLASGERASAANAESRSMILGHLAQLHRERGHTKPEEEALQAALNLRQQLVATQPASAKQRADLANSQSLMGAFYQQNKRTSDGQKAFQQSIDTWARLAADNPRVTRYQQGLAVAHNTLGYLYYRAGELNEAEKAYLKGLEIRERLANDHPKHLDFQVQTAESYNNLGILYQVLNRLPDAEQIHRKVLAIFQQLSHDHPLVPGFQETLAKSHNNLALVLRENKQLDRASVEFREALRIWDGLAEKHRGVREYDYSVAMVLHNLALVSKDQNQFEAAEKGFRDAVAILERLVKDQRTRTELVTRIVQAQNNLAHIYRDTGRLDDALAAYLPAEQALRGILSDDRRNAEAMKSLRNIHWGRAQTLELLERWPEAVQEWVRTLEMELQIQPVSYRDQVCLLRARARAHVGQHADAVREADELVGKPSLSAESYNAAAKVYAAAAVAVRRDANLAASEQERQAEAHAARAVELLRKAHAAGHFKIPASIARMEKDSDLKLLYQRDDFKKLLAELEAGKQPEKK